jgi:hypothetical protein
MTRRCADAWVNISRPAEGPPCGERGEDAGCWLGTGASNSARSMSYPTVELLGRIERRRRFNVEQKAGGAGGVNGGGSEPLDGLAGSAEGGAVDRHVTGFRAAYARRGIELELGERPSFGFQFFIAESREAGMREAAKYYEENMKMFGELRLVRTKGAV